MPLAPSTKLGPYEIAVLLGAGGMGEVYRARDTRLGRNVAIKILPALFSSDPVRKPRFEREAKTISSLNHPHICVLHDVGHQEGMDYLVMECVEGETLAKRLEKGSLPLEQVLKFLLQSRLPERQAGRCSRGKRQCKQQSTNKPAGPKTAESAGAGCCTAPIADCEPSSGRTKNQNRAGHVAL